MKELTLYRFQDKILGIIISNKPKFELKYFKANFNFEFSLIRDYIDFKHNYREAHFKDDCVLIFEDYRRLDKYEVIAKLTLTESEIKEKSIEEIQKYKLKFPEEFL